MRVQMLIACVCATLIADALRHVAVLADEPAAAHPEPTAKSPATAAAPGLAEGWEKNIDVPAWRNVDRTLLPASSLRLSVHQGWLVARYESSDRGLEWQIVLAQATSPKVPDVQLQQPTGFEVNYGPYFIREYAGRLRVFRERKTKDSPRWPAAAIDQGARLSQSGIFGAWENRERVISLWEAGDWRWLGCGLTDSQLRDIQG